MSSILFTTLVGPVVYPFDISWINTKKDGLDRRRDKDQVRGFGTPGSRTAVFEIAPMCECMQEKEFLCFCAVCYFTTDLSSAPCAQRPHASLMGKKPQDVCAGDVISAERIGINIFQNWNWLIGRRLKIRKKNNWDWKKSPWVESGHSWNCDPELVKEIPRNTLGTLILVFSFKTCLLCNLKDWYGSKY